MSDAVWDAALSWLHKQLDEEEQLAINGARFHGDRRPQDSDWSAAPDVYVTSKRTGSAIGHFQWANAAKHAARHDPARVLREIEAKRQILALVVPAIEGMESQIEGEWGVPEFHNGPDGTPVRVREPYPSVAQDLVRYVAAPFAGLPDFPEVLRLDPAEDRR